VHELIVWLLELSSPLMMEMTVVLLWGGNSTVSATLSLLVLVMYTV
jgi:hypothetical protein